MIQLNIEVRRYNFSQEEQFLARGCSDRQALLPQFNNIMEHKHYTDSNYSIRIDPSLITRMIKKYSEQLIYQPVKE